MHLIEDLVSLGSKPISGISMGSYPSWLRSFTVNKMAIATASSSLAYPKKLNLPISRS